MHLVGAMNWLRNLVDFCGRCDLPPDFVRRRHAQTGQFMRAKAREIGDIGWMISRQPQLADFAGNAEPPKVLHRA